MKIYFTSIILFRTNKEAAGCGHPIDRVQLDDLIVINFDKNDFETSHEGFIKWSNYINTQVDKYLCGLFSSQLIIGSTKPKHYFNPDNGGLDDTSERHVIRVDDIRNIVILNYEEHKSETFEKVFEFSL